MRIALLTHNYVPECYGGREIHVWRLAESLAKKQDVTIFTGDVVEKARVNHEEGVRVVRLPRFLFPVILKPRTDYRIIPLLYKYLCKYDFDVVHTHGLRHFNSEIAYLYCKRKNVPLVLTYHGFYPQGFSELSVKLYDFLFASRTVNHAKKIICVSQMQVEDLKRFYGERIMNKIVLIPNGVSIPKIRFTKVLRKFGLEKKKIVLGMGRLIPRKNFDTLIKSAPKVLKRNPDAHFLIVGEDFGIKKDLQNLVNNLGVQDNVTFVDKLPWEDALSLINQSTCFVVPSVYEGLPSVMLESMFLHTPLVVSSITGFSGVIRHNENGLVFAYGDAFSLSRQLNRLLQDRKLRNWLSRNASRTVKAFGWGNVTRKIMRIYGEVLK
jgi:glycosyltransferase involved in cell wall biosynthesis